MEYIKKLKGMKKWILGFIFVSTSFLLFACKQGSTPSGDIQLTLHETFYDANSVSNGHLTGWVKAITFEEDNKGHILHFQRSFSGSGFIISHYRVNFIYTIIDEDTLFITMNQEDVVLLEDHNNAFGYSTLKTEVMMVSRDLILSNNGTHYLRETYLLENNYLASTEYNTMFFKDYQLYRGNLVENETFILDTLPKINAYMSGHPESSAYVSLPLNFFENGGKYLVIHVETEANKKLEMRHFTYLNGELHVTLREVDDTSLTKHTTYLYLMFYFFDSFSSLTYTIQQ